MREQSSGYPYRAIGYVDKTTFEKIYHHAEEFRVLMLVREAVSTQRWIDMCLRDAQNIK